MPAKIGCIIIAVVVALSQTVFAAALIPEPDENGTLNDIPLGLSGAHIPEKEPYMPPGDDSETIVLNVVFPTGISLILDPLELAGRGSLYSEEFAIHNYGDSDVILTFYAVKYMFANDLDFVSLTEPPDDPEIGKKAEHKAAYVELLCANRDLPAIVLTDREYPDEITFLLKASDYDENGDFLSLNEESSLEFYFAGSLTPYPRVPWNAGDLEVSISYAISAG